jgi:YndJ-like protein
MPFKSGPLILGLLIWLAYLLWSFPTHPLEEDWVKLLLLLAPTVFVPLACEQVGMIRSQKAHYAILTAALALVFAFYLPQGWYAGTLALPWLGFSLWALWANVHLVPQVFRDHPHERSFFSAFLFLPVGAAWAFADRMGIRPLGFDPTIVLLTAAHFHYAGFLLALGTAHTYKQLQARQVAQSTWVSWGILLAPAFVAVGITVTQLGGSYLVESLAATIMVISALGAAYLQVLVAFQFSLPVWQVRLKVLGSLFLSLGMILAFLYAWRFYPVLPWLSIPWMYALHGTLNTLGVGLFGVLGNMTAPIESNKSSSIWPQAD